MGDAVDRALSENHALIAAILEHYAAGRPVPAVSLLERLQINLEFIAAVAEQGIPLAPPIWALNPQAPHPSVHGTTPQTPNPHAPAPSSSTPRPVAPVASQPVPGSSAGAEPVMNIPTPHSMGATLSQAVGATAASVPASAMPAQRTTMDENRERER